MCRLSQSMLMFTFFTEEEGRKEEMKEGGEGMPSGPELGTADKSLVVYIDSLLSRPVVWPIV